MTFDNLSDKPDGSDTLLFRTFNSQEERREFGGSDFIEFQYCKLDKRSKINKIVSIDAIGKWKDDSLYLFGDDIDEFFSHYGKIFNGGIYNNEKCGIVDFYGINYYTLEQSNLIIERVNKENPLDYQILLNWLDDVKKYNGFYILGV
ncbi:hypothetical protein [Paratissierella segnis]|jgi:hypothetical protein|uniref:Uncharacterized protein n=1 Tax=Paratissierella segnis TaxID=2763679 RepID=A0A926EU89_9FIRM|nr:hypothetical protein [Paratissierella segnis]MBC8587751.1 hypothetical protein [Paratissierella segnis]